MTAYLGATTPLQIFFEFDEFPYTRLVAPLTPLSQGAPSPMEECQILPKFEALLRGLLAPLSPRGSPRGDPLLRSCQIRQIRHKFEYLPKRATPLSLALLGHLR